MLSATTGRPEARFLNGNLGLSDHNYYQTDHLYTKMIRETWDRLLTYGIAERSVEAIDNSDVFKYSPYKSLSAAQQQGPIERLRPLVDPRLNNVVVQGGAATESRFWRYFFSSLFIPTLKNQSFGTDAAMLRHRLGG